MVPVYRMQKGRPFRIKSHEVAIRCNKVMITVDIRDYCGLYQNIEVNDMSSMICSDVRALVVARCLENVTSTSYDMAHTDDVRWGLWTVA